MTAKRKSCQTHRTTYIGYILGTHLRLGRSRPDLRSYPVLPAPSDRRDPLLLGIFVFVGHHPRHHARTCPSQTCERDTYTLPLAVARLFFSCSHTHIAHRFLKSAAHAFDEKQLHSRRFHNFSFLVSTRFVDFDQMGERKTVGGGGGREREIEGQGSLCLALVVTSLKHLNHPDGGDGQRGAARVTAYRRNMHAASAAGSIQPVLRGSSCVLYTRWHFVSHRLCKQRSQYHSWYTHTHVVRCRLHSRSLSRACEHMAII